MLQEFNYYITKCYCTCSFILGREMFWKRRCILQRKAFSIQGLTGDRKSSGSGKIDLYTEMGPVKSEEDLSHSSSSSWTLLKRACIFLCVHHHYCVEICDLKSHMSNDTNNIFTSATQIRAVLAVLFLSPFWKAEYPLIQQAGTQMFHQYSKTKNVQFIAWCM